MKKLIKLLKDYETRHAQEYHPNSQTPRFSHWYRLMVYSDGSGCIQDTCGGINVETIFKFSNLEELEEELIK